MKALTFILAFITCNALAAQVYLEDGTVIEIPVGSRLYVTDRPAWTFTRFNEGGFDIRPVEPTVEVTEVCQDGLTFGGNSGVCEELVTVEIPEEAEEEACDGLTFGGGSDAC
jgi:hypothetical protein